MKKSIFTLVLALVAFTATAQEKMWVGGTVGLWSSKTSGADSELSFKVMPEFGFVINENLGVGIALGAAHTHTDGLGLEGTLSGADAANIYTVNPFLRYTFLKGNIGGLFVDGGVAYNHVKGVAGGGKSNTLEVGFRPGVAVNVTNTVSLIGKFGFLGYQYGKVEKVKTNSFGFDFDMTNIQLGMNLKF